MKCKECGGTVCRGCGKCPACENCCAFDIDESRFVSSEFTLVAQATVKQAVFDATGEVFVTDTHTTEAEQNGYRETQMRMDIGPGERPIEDLPMFSNALDEKEESKS